MSRNLHVPAEQLAADIKDGTIDTVVVAFADHHGRLVGKRAEGEFYLDVVARHGTENCDYLLACDLDYVPIPGFAWASYEQGYGDMRAVVDPATIRYLPWLETTVLVLADLVDVDSGAPVEISPRQVLRRQVEAAAELGLVPMIGSELEFFVFDDSFERANAAGYRDLTPSSPYLEDYNVLQTTKEEHVIGRIRRGLRDAGFPVEYSKGEAGRGQHEINLTYQPAVEMADTSVVFKNAVKEIVAQTGRAVTFMAKPHSDDGGSSCHIHASLWSEDSTRSVMPGDGPHGMSDEFRWFLGGLLASAREFALLLAPNVNSYKRFVAESWAPTAIAWDTDNRTLGFRVVGRGQALRVESRIAGADANAYHAFAATIAGGLHGIRNRIEPVDAYSGNGYAADDLPRIPSSFVEAIALWRDSALARECFGDAVHGHVLRHAEYEWQAFNAAVTDWERQRYFERI